MQTTETLSDYERERGKPEPSLLHGLTQARLIGALASCSKKRFSVLSELDLRLGGYEIVPDISVYPYQAPDWTRDQEYATTPPLLAVEIQTLGQDVQDLEERAGSMLAAGVRSCWLVQPAMQTITVYHDAAHPKIFSEGVVADSAVDVEVVVADVFAEA